MRVEVFAAGEDGLGERSGARVKVRSVLTNSLAYRGKLSAFSTDLLIKLCDRAGIEVRVAAELHAEA